MIVICFINGTEVKAETSEDGRYGYQIFDDETKEIEITYYYGSEEEVVVPSEINGYTVSRIDLTIFRQCSNMVSLTLPETIRGFTHGGMNGCDALQEIIVEGEEGAFQTINGVLFSGEELIWYPAAKSDTEYFVPGNVYSIGVGAFTECKNLEKITLPEGIEEINIGAFEDCTNLQYVNLPDSIEELEREVFMNCSSLDNIVLPGKITELKSSTFEGCSSLNNIILPSKLVSIGMNVFSGCTSLTEINIPDQVESIGWYAFSECSSLKSVDIPASVKTIDKENPFQWCYALETINVDAQNEWYYSQDGVLFEKATKSLMIYPVGKTDTVYNVTEGTLEIGNGAFWGCSALKDINLPSTLQTIKIHAFYDCSNLTSIDIPEGITEIEDRIFAGCSSLKEIKLPETVTSIGLCAFDSCSSLEIINIPDNVSMIQWGTFAGCKNLKTIKLPNNLTAIEAEAFTNCKSLSTVTIPKTVQEIESNPFLGCDSLIEINVENGNTHYISQEGVLFDKNDKSLISYPGGKDTVIYTVPTGIQKIGNSAFCSVDGALRTVELPDSVENIGANAFWLFYEDNNLSITDLKVFNPNCKFSEDNEYYKQYTIDKDMTLHGYSNSTTQEFAREFGNAFEELNENDTLTNPSIFSPESGQESTDNNPSMDNPSTQQPSGNNNVGVNKGNDTDVNKNQQSSRPAAGTILNDSKTKATYIVSTAGTSVTYKAPANKKVKKVTIPSSVTINGITYKVISIAPNAFKKCKKLKKVTIGTGVTEIGKKAFAGCKNLKNVIVKSKSLKKVGKNAFKDINKTAKIKVPKKKMKVYTKLFKKAKVAKNVKITK